MFVRQSNNNRKTHVKQVSSRFSEHFLKEPGGVSLDLLPKGVPGELAHIDIGVQSMYFSIIFLSVGVTLTLIFTVSLLMCKTLESLR